MCQIVPPQDIEGQEIVIYVKMVIGHRDSEKTSEKKMNIDEQQRLYQ